MAAVGVQVAVGGAPRTSPRRTTTAPLPVHRLLEGPPVGVQVAVRGGRGRGHHQGDIDGATPMYIARENGQLSVCKWLFEVGAAADITKAANNGWTRRVLSAKRKFPSSSGSPSRERSPATLPTGTPTTPSSAATSCWTIPRRCWSGRWIGSRPTRSSSAPSALRRGAGESLEAEQPGRDEQALQAAGGRLCGRAVRAGARTRGRRRRSGDDNELKNEEEEKRATA